MKGSPARHLLRPPGLLCRVGTHRRPTSSDGHQERSPNLCRGWAVPGMGQDQEHRTHHSQRHRVKCPGGGAEDLHRPPHASPQSDGRTCEVRAL